MQNPPENLQPEIKTLGRIQVHRLRRVAAMLQHYRIDDITIEDRLIERGCSRELADWIVRSAAQDSNLHRRIEEAEAPEPLLQVILKGLNGLVLLIIVGLVTQFIQFSQNLAILFVFAPFLLIASFIGFFMTMRAIVEAKKRWSDRR